MDFYKQEQIEYPFIIAGVVVKPATNELVVNKKSVIIEDKVMRVLVYLVMNRSRIVTRKELFANLWPDVFVSQDSLNRCISIIRRLWSESDSQAQIILTVRNRGYRIMEKMEPFNEAKTRGRFGRPVYQKVKYLASGVALTLGTISLFLLFYCVL